MSSANNNNYNTMMLTTAESHYERSAFKEVPVQEIVLTQSCLPSRCDRRRSHHGRYSKPVRSVRFQDQPIMSTNPVVVRVDFDVVGTAEAAEKETLKDLLWFCSKDYKQMRQRELLLSREISKSYLDSAFSVDGVESLSYRKARQARQQTAQLVVFDEQERHWAMMEDFLLESHHLSGGVGCGNDDGDHDDDEEEETFKAVTKMCNDQARAVAKKYARSSHISRRIAFETGLRVAKQVKEMNNSEANELCFAEETFNGDDSNASILTATSTSTVDSSEDYQLRSELVPQVE